MNNNENQQILSKIVDDFKESEGVQAIVLGGSSAAKQDDNTSDYDIYIYSDKEIDVSKRREIAEKYSDNPEINNQYWETGDEWKILETGKQIDIMYRSTQWIEDRIENVWKNNNASLGYTTCFVDNVNKSAILYDKNGWFENLQQKTKTPYTDDLAKNIINKNLPLLKDKPASSYYEQIKKAAKRKDFVSVNHRISAFLSSYFDILFAKNKVLHPGEKRLKEYALQNCKVLPKDFEKDITDLLISDIANKPEIAADMAQKLKQIL